MVNCETYWANRSRCTSIRELLEESHICRLTGGEFAFFARMRAGCGEELDHAHQRDFSRVTSCSSVSASPFQNREFRMGAIKTQRLLALARAERDLSQ